MSTFDIKQYSYKAIIFDCDGTLVNSAPAHFAAYQSALQHQGAVFNLDWYQQRLGLSRVELLTEFSDYTSIQLDIAQAVAESEAQFLVRASELTAISEVVHIAKSHYGQLPMGVASSGLKLGVHLSLESLQIDHLFEVVLKADDVSNCKPDPEIYILAAQKLQTDISACLVFEDTDEGLASASSAGAQFVDVRTFAALYSK